jgi:uncharacterized protein YkwD
MGQHHHRGQHYLKTYWPYLPMVAILALGLVANSWLGNLHRSVLGYATDMSASSLWSDTNTQRTDNGLGALTLNTRLNSAAQAKANDMAARDYWSHNTPDGQTPWSFITAAHYSYQTAGENLAYGFDTAGDTITGWMNSPEHRANILNTTYREVGFGIINIPEYQNSGPETLVVAMYASPAVQPAPAVTKPVAVTPKPVSQPAAATAAHQAAPVPSPATAAPKPTANATLQPATASVNKHVASTAPEPQSQRIARFQLVANSASLNFFTIGLVGVFGFMFLMFRHSLAWHRRLVRGERFILRHPALDLAAVTIVSLSIILGNTTGLIR